MDFFRAYEAKETVTSTPTYFIESTAPDNVDDTENVDNTDKEMPQDLRESMANQVR